MNNNDKPLGLPRGSIRAILALGIVGVGLGYVWVTREFPGELMVVMGTVIAFYFAMKSGAEKPEG